MVETLRYFTLCMQPPSQIVHRLLVFSVKVMLLILDKLLLRVLPQE